MPRTKAAFLVAPLIASAMYWWLETVEHVRRVGVSPSAGLGFFALILLFAYAGTGMLAVPAFLVLRHFGWAQNLPMLIVGTCLGWLFIAFADGGRPWLHPEAFATGLIAASTFLLIRNRVFEGSQGGK